MIKSVELPFVVPSFFATPGTFTGVKKYMTGKDYTKLFIKLDVKYQIIQVES
jgi:hypothetical protein